jgi:hypothetical protein
MEKHRDWREPRKEGTGGPPTINDRHVYLVGDEARYHRRAIDERHPDADYSIPDKQRPGWRIDVILLILTAVCVACYVTGYLG